MRENFQGTFSSRSETHLKKFGVWGRAGVLVSSCSFAAARGTIREIFAEEAPRKRSRTLPTCCGGMADWELTGGATHYRTHLDPRVVLVREENYGSSGGRRESLHF